jgi:hypothetical protein
MATNSAEGLTCLGIVRYVRLPGSFINQVSRDASVFGLEVTNLDHSLSAVTAEGPEGDFRWAVPLGTPLMTVYRGDKEVKVSLLDRRVHPSFNYMEKFTSTVTRMDKALYDPAEGVAESSLGLREALDEIGMGYGIRPEQQHELELKCTEVAVQPNTMDAGLGHELVLIPDGSSDVTLMLADQITACFRGLQSYNKGLAFPANPMPLNIPFARLPRQTSSEQRTHIMRSVRSLLHESGHVLLDGVGIEFIDPPRKRRSSW